MHERATPKYYREFLVAVIPLNNMLYQNIYPLILNTTMKSKELKQILEFLQRCERLKDTVRSSFTSQGNQESVAAHSWRLCLMALTLEDYFPNINISHVLKICIIHDLGEALSGDVPAPEQLGSPPKAETERDDLFQLMDGLSSSIQQNITALWEEYEQAATSEAKLAKALDKLETIIQHNQGDNPPNFDYYFNLEYGTEYTDYHPIIKKLRDMIDVQTKKLADQS
jgi:putative hydrolase of HD superfamily